MPPYFRHFLLWSHILEKVHVRWRPLSSRQLAADRWAMGQSRVASALWSAVGRGGANRQKGVRTSQESDQAWPLRPGEWSTGRTSKTGTHSLQKPEGLCMRKHKAGFCANIKEAILITSRLWICPLSGSAGSKPSVGGNRELRQRAQAQGI